MTTNQSNQAARALNERKEALIERGLQCRMSVVNSRRAVHASLKGDAIARSAFSHLSGNAAGLLGNYLKVVGGSNRKLLLSLAMSGVSLLSRKGLIKPVLRGALLLGAVGAAFAWWQGKGRRKDSSATGPKR